MKIWRAHVDSPNFSFEAYGKTASEAKANVTRGLSAHVQRTGATNDWLADVLQDIITQAAELFHNVGPIEGKLKDLIDLMGSSVIHARSTQPFLAYLNTEASNVPANPTTPNGSRKPGSGKKPEPKDGGAGNPISPNPSEGAGDIAVPEPIAVEINKRHN